METSSKLKDYFKRYPLSQECFATSDGKLFHQSGPAQSYAGGLEDGKVTRHTREDYVKGIPTTAEGVDSGDASKVDDVTLDNFNPEDKDAYVKGLALVANLGLELPNKTKGAVLQAIADARAASLLPPPGPEDQPGDEPAPEKTEV